MIITLLSRNKEQTIALGEFVASYLFRGSIICFDGDLGAGKTTFTNGIGKALGVKEKMLSPTFNILKCYFDSKIPLYHIDAYRLEDGNKDIGLEEYIEGDGVAVIEWPMYIKEIIPEGTLNITIVSRGDDLREITFSSENIKYEPLFERLGRKR